LNILSGISVTAFRGAVANSDVKALSQISGVGKKTAERIVVELKDKVGTAGAWEAASAQRALSAEDQKVNDAVLALMALGFKQIEAHDCVRMRIPTKADTCSNPYRTPFRSCRTVVGAKRRSE